MHPTRQLDRRTFVLDLGRGAFALAVLGIAGCAPGAGGTPRPSGTAAASGTAGASTTAAAASPSITTGPGAAGSNPPATGAPSPGTAGLAWSRVNLGFVSAYVLVRGAEAAVVDTGVEGSADEIEAALAAVGLDWGAVAHIVLTHHHPDHVGSAAAVMEAAADATAYAGPEDIPSITVPRALVPVQDGDTVLDLEIVATPGHTAGHVCVYDPGAGVLVAGDALRTEGGAIGLPGEEFTDDMAQAKESIKRLGGLAFETMLPGHGDPIEGGAGAAVAEFALSL